MKPRLLVLSHVLPFPGSAGQQQRVMYKLRAAREVFHVTFATPCGSGEAERIRAGLAEHCDEAVLLPSVCLANPIARVYHGIRARMFEKATGLKKSNYAIGEQEFSSARIAKLIDRFEPFDCVLYEYWHGHKSTEVFRGRNIPTVLDMHNILWKSHETKLLASGVDVARTGEIVSQYRRHEEAAFSDFDGVIAINRAEEAYVQKFCSEAQRVFYSPMGVDLNLWPSSWTPSQPKRLAFYGGLASAHNAQDALRCVRGVMPIVWKKYPDIELWLVGSNPPEEIKTLEQEESRIKVTGFVKEPQTILNTMTGMLCPWSGTFGFRSRVVETAALGTPVVATPEAVDGMELVDGKGILLANTDEEIAAAALRLLDDDEFAKAQSKLARAEMERLYSYENCYLRLMNELAAWAKECAFNSAN